MWVWMRLRMLRKGRQDGRMPVVAAKSPVCIHQSTHVDKGKAKAGELKFWGGMCALWVAPFHFASSWLPANKTVFMHICRR